MKANIQVTLRHLVDKSEAEKGDLVASKWRLNVEKKPIKLRLTGKTKPTLKPDWDLVEAQDPEGGKLFYNPQMLNLYWGF